MTEYHVVQKGETLTKIAKMHGTTVNELAKLNQISNPNRLEIGQEIELLSTNVLGVQLLFLDLARDPVSGLEYIMEFCGKRVSGKTEANGLGKKIYTNAASDIIRILIKRFDGTLKDIGFVSSGYGNKLVTIICSSVKVEAKTEKHPDLKDGERPDPREPQKPIYNPKEKQPPTNSKKELGPKTTPVKTSDGKPLIKVEGDIQHLNEFLDTYNGEKMSDADYQWAASELKIEKPVIKAFAVVESGSSGFYKLGDRDVPKILYERHKFSSKTGHIYSAKYPDLSLPNAYYNSKQRYVLASASDKKARGIPMDVEYYRPISKKKDSAEVKASALSLEQLIKSGKATAENDKYSNVDGSYKRLIKAYQLNQNAALESCSWGAFQIMGEYWKIMGYKSVKEFTKAMAQSPREQIKAFVRYIDKVNPVIKRHLKAKDWVGTAKAYNGPSYADNNYDKKLEAAYKKFKDEQ